MIEQIKVLRGAKALEVIEEMLDNDFVLTPDYRLIYLKRGHILVKKSSAVGFTCPGPSLQIEYEQKPLILKSQKS